MNNTIAVYSGMVLVLGLCFLTLCAPEPQSQQPRELSPLEACGQACDEYGMASFTEADILNRAQCTCNTPTDARIEDLRVKLRVAKDKTETAYEALRNVRDVCRHD